jgi:hypothetical protein
MLAVVRDRLTYANVVATLALFVALGGSSYAALSITSKDVRNRSLKGGDLRKNTITGTEVNESKLKQVPKARTAETAGTADISKSSGTATTAGSATTAALADTAKDAQNLAGQGVGAFEKSTRVAFGRAGVDPADQASEQVLISWPEMGVQLTTASNQAACAAGELRIGVRNTKAPAAPVAFIYEEDSPAALATAGGGATARPCTNDNTNEFQGMITDSTGRALFVDCRNAQGDLRCLGIRSEP